MDSQNKLTNAIASFFGYQQEQAIIVSRSQLPPMPTPSFVDSGYNDSMRSLYKKAIAKGLQIDMRNEGCPAGNDAHIIIVIKIDPIFEKVYRYTSQKSRFIQAQHQATKTAGAEHAVDLYAFSEDERGLFDDFLKAAAVEVYGGLSGYGKNIPDKNFAYNAEIDDEACILYKLSIPGLGYLENTVLLLYENIELALYYYVLMMWYKLAMIPDEMAINSQLYDSNISTIRLSASIGKKATRIPVHPMGF